MTAQKADIEVDFRQIESTLQQVARGELSPRQAAAMLIATAPATLPKPQTTPDDTPTSRQAATKPGDLESLDSLLDRLGPPPPDLVDRWSRQLASMAARHEQECGRPFPPCQRSEVTIDRDGRLWFHSRPSRSDSECQRSPEPRMAASRIHLKRLIRSLEDAPPPRSSADAITVSADRPAERRNPAQAATPNKTITNNVTRRAGTRRAGIQRAGIQRAGIQRAGTSKPLIAAAVGLAITLTAVVWWTRGGRHRLASPPAAAPMLGPRATPATADSKRPPHPAGDKFDLAGDAGVVGQVTTEPPPLETVASLSPLDPSDPLAVPDHPRGLDHLIPIGPDPASESGLREQPQPPLVTHARTSILDPSTDAGDADLGVPEPSPQAARVSSQIASIELPEIDDAAPLTLPWDRLAGDLRLELPLDVPLRLGPDGWIRDAIDRRPIAQVGNRDGVTVWAWANEASGISEARAVTHGRLRNAAGQTLYLRPRIEADPWPIRFDRDDVQPSWDLRSPLASRATRVAIDFDLPEGLQLGWVEPLPATAIRRGRGVAVVTLADADPDAVAIGVRLDLRGGTTLDCRIRFAARWNPGGPWLKLSSSALTNWADQITAARGILKRQQEHWAEWYPRASAPERARLRVARAENERRAQVIDGWSTRLDQIERLVEQLESSGRIRIRLWVEWPDGEIQPVFSMESPPDPDA